MFGLKEQLEDLLKINLINSSYKDYDFQCNDFIKSSYEDRNKIIQNIKINFLDIIDKVDLTEKGFINLKISKEYLEKELQRIFKK